MNDREKNCVRFGAFMGTVLTLLIGGWLSHRTHTNDVAKYKHRIEKLEWQFAPVEQKEEETVDRDQETCERRRVEADRELQNARMEEEQRWIGTPTLNVPQSYSTAARPSHEGAEPGSGNDSPRKDTDPLPKKKTVCEPVVKLYPADGCEFYLGLKPLTKAQYLALDPLRFVPIRVLFNEASHATSIQLIELLSVQWELIEGFVCEERTDGRWYEVETGEPVMFAEMQGKDGKVSNRWLMPLGGGEVQRRKNAQKPPAKD